MPFPIAIPLAVKVIAGMLAAAGVGGNIYSSVSTDGSMDDAIKAIRRNYSDNPAISNMSDAELKGILKNYAYEDNDFFNLWGLFGDKETVNWNSALKDLSKLSSFKENMPSAPDYAQLYKDAEDAIAAENAEILEMYDADKTRVTDLYNQQLSDSNAAYNRNVDQLLANDYQKNAQLLDTMRSEMNRSQRNALESGASAGLRIAGNINTMLSLQNRQSQQSLETSNNLAQMLLNQQQANAGLRGEYSNYLSQDTANRAALKSGTAERTENMFNQYATRADRIYDRQMQDYENKYYATAGATNGFANAYHTSLYNNQHK